MKKWATANPLNCTLDEGQLKEAIANFGKVDMDGVLLLPNVEESKCLPSRYRFLSRTTLYQFINWYMYNRVEEYFEEDHQFLNKPLNMDTDVIDIKFPKLPVNKDQLQQRSLWFSFAKKTEETKPDSSYGPYRKVVMPMEHSTRPQ